MKSGIFIRNCFLIVMGLSLISPPAIAQQLRRAVEKGFEKVAEKGVDLYFDDMKKGRNIDCTRVADGCASRAAPGRLPNFTPSLIEATKRAFPDN
jgi:hypothetical protein